MRLLSPKTPPLFYFIYLCDYIFASLGSVPIIQLSAFVAPGSCLAGLTAALFLGVAHRELLMDITDVASDAATGIKTVPVVYGKKKAALAATAFAAAAAAAVAFASAAASASASATGLRRCLGLVGAARMAQRAAGVCRCAGDAEKVDAAAQAAIDESQLSFVFVLAAFL